MTRKEKELKVLEAFGLKAGDKIKACYVIYEIVEEEEFHILHPVDNGVSELVNVGSIVHVLLDYDWKKIKPSLKNKKCEDFDDCDGCPLIEWMCGDLLEEPLSNKTVGEVYDKIENKLFEAKQEIYGGEE